MYTYPQLQRIQALSFHSTHFPLLTLSLSFTYCTPRLEILCLRCSSVLQITVSSSSSSRIPLSHCIPLPPIQCLRRTPLPDFSVFAVLSFPLSQCLRRHPLPCFQFLPLTPLPESHRLLPLILSPTFLHRRRANALLDILANAIRLRRIRNPHHLELAHRPLPTRLHRSRLYLPNRQARFPHTDRS